MGDRGRLIIRKVYVLRAAFVGLLFGLVVGTLFITSFLWGLWSLSDARGITHEGITQNDLIFIGIIAVIGFALLSLFAALFVTMVYNLLAKIGGGIHVDLEEKESSVLSLGSV